MNYYTSDLHFGCQAVFDRTGRPFKDLEEMKEVIINNINNTLKRDDTLYILGDISCAEYDPTSELKAMNCRKILIKGNHDARWCKHRHFRNQFDEIHDIKAVRECGTRIVLCHYPLAEWDGYYKGHYHFYGHIHNSNEGAALIMNNVERAINVGVDVNDFMPKTAKELLGFISEDSQKAV